MKSNRLFLLVTLACVMVSCVAPRKPGLKMEVEKVKVVEVMTSYRQARPNHARTAMSGAHFGILGSHIGTGGSAHAVGAAAGVLVGSALGYWANRESRRESRWVTVRMASGSLMQFPAPIDRPISPGQSVWVAHGDGKPPRLVDVPEM